MKIHRLLAAAGLALVSGTSLATPSAWFVVEGDTFSAQFRITNTSGDSEKITALSFVLPTGFVFDTVSTDFTNQARPFMSSVNGYLLDTSRSSLPADGGNSLGLAFNGFDGSPEALDLTSCNGVCRYGWTVDVDTLTGTSSGRDVIVNSSELMGSQIAVTFSDGTVLSGLLGACTANGARLDRCGTTSNVAFWEASGNTGGGGNAPEPGSLALAGLALLGLGAAHRARKAG